MIREEVHLDRDRAEQLSVVRLGAAQPAALH
jgi:hypothetical protein